MKHLTLCQRYKIQSLIELNHSKTSIAHIIGVNKSSIGREIDRNSQGIKYYDAEIAHQVYLKRKSKAGAKRSPVSPELLEQIDIRLDKEFSPEQITGQLKEHHQEFRSHTWIYKYIWNDKDNGGELYKHLRRANKKKRKKYGGGPDKRGSIKNRVSIDKRPKIVDKMSRIGDWEADTIIGKDHKGVIVSLTERRSMAQLIKKVKSKNADVVADAIIAMVKDSGIPAITMTFDNGKEFAYHEKIAKQLSLKAYFAHPYSSFERGLNENQNGLVRQYIPKKSNFDDYSHQQIKKIQDLLNFRPRKSLGFYSPIEILAAEANVNLNCKISLESKGWFSG